MSARYCRDIHDMPWWDTYYSKTCHNHCLWIEILLHLADVKMAMSCHKSLVLTSLYIGSRMDNIQPKTEIALCCYKWMDWNWMDGVSFVRCEVILS